eukprot:GEZU01036000.1.p1 GENE.GEZU01036000.1~~GEZU01036000.1.p1  ORF type:complete len:661 (-),score=139.66 GEZU01036000.1:41-2023(-)
MSKLIGALKYAANYVLGKSEVTKTAPVINDLEDEDIIDYDHSKENAPTNQNSIPSNNNNASKKGPQVNCVLTRKKVTPSAIPAPPDNRSSTVTIHKRARGTLITSSPLKQHQQANKPHKQILKTRKIVPTTKTNVYIPQLSTSPATTSQKQQQQSQKARGGAGILKTPATPVDAFLSVLTSSNKDKHEVIVPTPIRPKPAFQSPRQQPHQQHPARRTLNQPAYSFLSRKTPTRTPPPSGVLRFDFSRSTRAPNTLFSPSPILPTKATARTAAVHEMGSPRKTITGTPAGGTSTNKSILLEEQWKQNKKTIDAVSPARQLGEIIQDMDEDELTVDDLAASVARMDIQKRLSLHILRERSKLYELERHLLDDKFARQISAELLTEFTDAFVKEIVESLVQDKSAELVCKQLIDEMSREVVFEMKEFLPLSEKELAEVRDALNPNLDPDEVLVSGFKVDMYRRLLLCLEDREWLNDEVINFYMNLLDERQQRYSSNELVRLPKCHFFNTFFYAQLTQRGYSYDKVKRWTRKIDLFSFDKIIIPVHLGVHWTCAVINLRDKRFEYYDSMNGSARTHLQNLKRYIEDENRDKRKEAEFKSWNADDFEFYNPKDSTPQQRNTWDCGVFSCKFANFVAQDLRFTFSQKNMQYFRKRMALEIIKKKVL